MTISVLLLVAPDFIRCAVLLVAIALGLQQLLSSHTSRSQRPPFWRAFSLISLGAAPFFVASGALGIAGWSFALNTEPALAKAKDLLWDSELVERIGWIFFDVGVVYLWFPNVVLAVFPSIGIRRSHLFVVFLLNLLLRVSVRILSLVSAGVVETSAATSGAACVLIALQIALLSTSSAFFRCSQRSRVSFTSCAVPWVTVCATLAMELASVSLRIDYKAPTVAQATMRLLGTLFAVLSISTLLVLFYAYIPADAGQRDRVVVICGPRGSQYVPSARGNGRARTPGTRGPSEDFHAALTRDPFASPPPGSSTVKIYRPVTAKAYSSQGKNNSEKGPLHPTKRDSTGSGAHFDAEFLERLVSLSFSSRNSTQQEDLAEATKFSRDSGFGDGRTGEMGVIQDGARGSFQAPQSAPSLRRSSTTRSAPRINSHRYSLQDTGRIGSHHISLTGSRLVSAGGLPRNTITFPVALPAGSENKLASSPDSRRSNFLRMVTDRPPTPADTLGLLSPRLVSSSEEPLAASPGSSASPATPTTPQPHTRLSTHSEKRAFYPSLSLTSPGLAPVLATPLGYGLGSPAQLKRATSLNTTQSANSLFDSKPHVLASLGSPAASSKDWTRSLASPPPSYAASPQTPLAPSSMLPTTHTSAKKTGPLYPPSPLASALLSPLSTAADWTSGLDPDLNGGSSGSSSSSSGYGEARNFSSSSAGASAAVGRK